MAEQNDGVVVNPEEKAFGIDGCRCYCGRAAKLNVSRTPKNPGRKFWVCSYHETHCDFFKWHDEWVNERAMLMLRESRLLNERSENFEVEIDGSIARLNSTLISTSQELAMIERSMDLYKIGFYTVLGILICRVFSN